MSVCSFNAPHLLLLLLLLLLIFPSPIKFISMNNSRGLIAGCFHLIFSGQGHGTQLPGTRLAKSRDRWQRWQHQRRWRDIRSVGFCLLASCAGAFWFHPRRLSMKKEARGRGREAGGGRGINHQQHISLKYSSRFNHLGLFPEAAAASAGAAASEA